MRYLNSLRVSHCIRNPLEVFEAEPISNLALKAKRETSHVLYQTNHRIIQEFFLELVIDDRLIIDFSSVG